MLKSDVMILVEPRRCKITLSDSRRQQQSNWGTTQIISQIIDVVNE